VAAPCAESDDDDGRATAFCGGDDDDEEAFKADGGIGCHIIGVVAGSRDVLRNIDLSFLTPLCSLGVSLPSAVELTLVLEELCDAEVSLCKARDRLDERLGAAASAFLLSVFDRVRGLG